jgi:hypothetical protein
MEPSSGLFSTKVSEPGFCVKGVDMLVTTGAFEGAVDFFEAAIDFTLFLTFSEDGVEIFLVRFIGYW